MISTFHLQDNGLNLFINNNPGKVSPDIEAVTVCDTVAFSATGVFADGSTRKIDWPASINVANAKFDVSDSNNPVFSAHSNATCKLDVTYDPQTTSVSILVSEGTFRIWC